MFCEWGRPFWKVAPALQLAVASVVNSFIIINNKDGSSQIFLLLSTVLVVYHDHDDVWPPPSMHVQYAMLAGWWLVASRCLCCYDCIDDIFLFHVPLIHSWQLERTRPAYVFPAHKSEKMFLHSKVHSQYKIRL